MKKPSLLSLLTGVAVAQIVLVDGTGDGSFESGNFCSGGTFTANGWTIVNGSQTNRWVIHTGAGAYHGSRAIYSQCPLLGGKGMFVPMERMCWNGR